MIFATFAGTKFFIVNMLLPAIFEAVSFEELIHAANGVRIKFPRETKVSTQLCDVTNQLYGECQKHGNLKSWANPEYLRKTSFAFSNTAWFCLTFFHF